MEAPGDDRLSRDCTIMGPAGLTAVFGMGTGVAPRVWSPGIRAAETFNSVARDSGWAWSIHGSIVLGIRGVLHPRRSRRAVGSGDMLVKRGSWKRRTRAVRDRSRSRLVRGGLIGVVKPLGC